MAAKPNGADAKANGRVTRIDAAHAPLTAPIKTPEPAPVELAMAAAGQSMEQFGEQLHAQAGQLSSYLGDRQRDVDDREAQLNARVAQLENELRTARLWVRERDHEFSEKEKQLQQRIEDLETQLEGLSATESSIDETREHQRLQLEQLEQQEQQLEKREQELQSRRKQLDEAEAMLVKHTRELQGARRQFEQERELAEADLTEERQILAERKQQLEEQVRTNRHEDEARSADIDGRISTAEQIKQEALGTFREALEMRILVEELWTEVAKSTSPAHVTQRLGQLRVQLSDQFRLDRQDLAARRNELLELGQRLETRSRQLREQRDELQGWMQRRESQIESQAARLVNRELELQREADQCTALRQEWADEKRQLQSQIRRLSAELRRATMESA